MLIFGFQLHISFGFRRDRRVYEAVELKRQEHHFHANISKMWKCIIIVVIDRQFDSDDQTEHIWILIAKTMNMTFLEVQGAQRDTMLCKGCQEEELGDEGGGETQKSRSQHLAIQVPHLKKAN